MGMGGLFQGGVPKLRPVGGIAAALVIVAQINQMRNYPSIKFILMMK